MEGDSPIEAEDQRVGVFVSGEFFYDRTVEPIGDLRAREEIHAHKLR